mmetsp:Transcript_17277/g.16739  ORF Transcript_17277/g.16739 Transcript_17277/m.16739 type:complete len:97 (+) Transcript_17277:94-384(+)|eukprot:CAMPEP_0197831546 /NCGR_PEP_ID=MMETSP1437-20131217/10752_1 /TAXON_ID=49252 ORGANISM="Eucampia antarctica, Strain CCMP1452" /NCGR_SAMPLE_ID=MMETSP1437 /ASSEMBLY_ACC=CAM_ASM_001096 /LENGTH=96 /DNA_ID=CAMNT_0043434503 /DNA_START=90 /DNA_END=380 /DNA_ORIENTATION=+
MGLSNAALKKRTQKKNKAAGIGDENGRIVQTKEPPKVSKCTVCLAQLTITKSNADCINHASNKHGKTLEECFPGSAAVSKAMVAAAAGGKKGKGKK